RILLSGTALCVGLLSTAAVAQSDAVAVGAQADPASQTASGGDSAGNDIVVVGSRIEGSRVTEALPVTVVSKDDITNTAAVSGDELFRSIPQMGDVTFNSQYIPNSSNSARGDVGSVNLRNLGPGNTLVLINGRRLVTHPVSQADENLVPVISYNTNAIPVVGVERLEVLRDGAAAIYGTDAVAGVVNVVLRDDYDGVSFDSQYGFAQGTGLRETSLNSMVGHNFRDGNITLFASYNHRDALNANDQDFTSSLDRRPLFDGTRFEDAASLDGTETTTPWASLQSPQSFGTIYQGSTPLTSSSGLFHIQPDANPGCATSVGEGICLGTGSLATSGAARNLRFDPRKDYNTTIIPKLDRINLYLTGHYDISPEVTLFGEAGYYYARTRSWQEPRHTLGGVPITVPASNYWNPFGPVTFADGTANPNRLPGTNVPIDGLPVTIRSYSFADLGPMEVVDKNSQYRLLAGIRFPFLGFKWETAGVYSAARVRDTGDGISYTKLQQQLALSTPDAYDPFNGSNLVDYRGADSTSSSQAALDAIRVKVNRIDKSTLAMWDLKGSKSDLLDLPGGPLGIAIGTELRRETQSDNRDPRLDGTIQYTDAVTGHIYPTDVVGESDTPDTKGHRVVASAYGELAIPLVSEDMHVPLVRHAELQVAGRYEHYSDVGSVAKPKVAGAWDVFDGVRFRGSWAQGFKAPNLEQLNATSVTRTNTRTDWIRCEAETRLPADNPLHIDSFTDCAERFSTPEQRAGNKELKPETSETWSVGAVLQPKFIPHDFGRFTFTVDLWHVKQNGIVGVFGGANALIEDYYDRLNGASNTNVVRAAPTAEDVALFTAAGMDPVGQILSVKDQYRNLLPQTASGIDFGFNWQLPNTSVGSFSFDLNVAYLRKFYRSPIPEVAALMAARDAGEINPGTTFSQAGGDLIGQGSRPKWKGSASLTWSYQQFQVGAFTQYVGSVYDPDLIDDLGEYWSVDSQLTGNLY
ncbi:MAG TPA: TonB-dependent receptor, partial [Nitrospira sp.]|nr:TonB-dependent receptor [Nitrospira sp.]